MKIYRVHIRAHNGRSVEYRYYANKAEAHTFRTARSIADQWDDGDLQTIEVDISKSGILNLLNTFASHPDNGC